MTRQQRFSATLLCVALLAVRLALADAYDPPAGYYDAATGTGAVLKQQLHDIIDGHTVLSYDSARANLQITDADPNQPGHMLTVYDRFSLDVSTINPGGTIPGWDSGNTWNREHTWPRSRAVGSSGRDDSDLFALRPALSSSNGSRGALNFGGEYGAQPYGSVDDGGATYWYPGDADAGMIAREEFYMAVRYDGSDANTYDLELGTGDVPNPTGDTDPPPQLGNLDRLIEWHFAAPPDEFERRRNQIIYDDYQHNRDPFIDRPELVWSVFVDQTNDSQITIAGGTADGNGGSTRNVDLGRVFVGGAVPGAQAFTLNKGGDDGTYYEVATTGNATSSISGRYNAFRTGGTDSESIVVGLDTNTATAGLRSGTVTIDNLDITTGGGAGHGANDANDAFNVNLTVLDHATPSFADATLATSLVHDFGSVTLGSSTPSFGFEVFNLTATPDFTADLDFDSVLASGDSGTLTTDLAAAAGSLSLSAGAGQMFTAMLDTASAGNFSATYTLMFSDENLTGAVNTSLTLTLTGEVLAVQPGDYNRDGFVDAADYGLWRRTYGQSVAQYSGADGDGDEIIGDGDYVVWIQNFGSPGAGSGAVAVPEPAGGLLLALAVGGLALSRKQRAV